MNWKAAALLCLAVFHTPDGKPLSVDTHHIIALREVTEDYKRHVAPGIKTILSVSGQNYGIIETVDEAKEEIENCIEGR